MSIQNSLQFVLRHLYRRNGRLVFLEGRENKHFSGSRLRLDYVEVIYHEDKDDQAQQNEQLLVFVRYPREDLSQFSEVHADPLFQPFFDGLGKVIAEIVLSDFRS